MADIITFELELKVDNRTRKEIENRLEIGRQIRNTVLGELVKRHDQMIRTKTHQKTYRQLSAVLKKLSALETKQDKASKQEKAKLKQDLNRLYDTLSSLRKNFGLTKADAEKYGKEIRYHFNETLDANTMQKMAERAWISYEKYLYRKSRKVYFKGRGEVRSIEGKSNKQGIRFINNSVYLTKSLSIPIVRKKTDIYAQELLQEIEEAVRKVKYCRIIRKTIRKKDRYYVQLVLSGQPPAKRSRLDGTFKRQLGKGLVGNDIGMKTIAVVGEKEVCLKELSPQTNGIDKELGKLNRKMDRSKRATNRKNYNVDGTIKKGKKTWVFSNRYKKLRAKRKELYRKQADIRKQSHNRDTNELLQFGDVFLIEKMSIEGLKKRSKKTEKNEKGKFKRKKRYGKTIGNKAVSLFLSLLKQKVEAAGGMYKEINTYTFKASQYDHKSNLYQKKKLSERWHVFSDGDKVQRDLYSAFLLRNSESNGKITNRTTCLETFDVFKTMHDDHILLIEKFSKQIPNSGIRIPAKV